MWKLNNTEKNIVCRRYIRGDSAPAIAADYDVSAPAIIGILSRRGVPRRTRRGAQKHLPLKETAFSSPTPEALYWAGFLMADGSIFGNTLALTLSDKDSAHVSAFRVFLGSGHALTKIHQSPSAPAIRLAVRSEALIHDLARWGVLPNKTFTALAKEEAIRSKDFWRGVVDGDGWVAMVHQKPYFNKHHKINAWSRPYDMPRLQLVGAEPLMHQFLQFVHSVVPSCKVTVRHHKSIFSVGLGWLPAACVIQELYYDGCIGLQRKVNSARNILSLAESWLRPSAGTSHASESSVGMATGPVWNR